MKNEDELIAQLTQLHFDNEKRIVILDRTTRLLSSGLFALKKKQIF